MMKKLLVFILVVSMLIVSFSACVDDEKNSLSESSAFESSSVESSLAESTVAESSVAESSVAESSVVESSDVDVSFSESSDVESSEEPVSEEPVSEDDCSDIFDWLTSSDDSYWDIVGEKPVIYLYPERETDVEVVLDYAGEITCVYPEYDGKWNVTAFPDGTLIGKNGMEYNYLYWEGVGGFEPHFSEGFCVAGEDTAEFLESALAKLGLNRREANEFIVYWLPQMEVNEYNLISFQFENYEEAARLTVIPAPDTSIRVFMSWKPLSEKVDIESQTLTSPERNGFTLVEWGGSKIED